MAIIISDGNVVETTTNEIPKGNYTLNEEKTHCENNGKVLNYDSNTGKVKFSFIGSDRCYLYFDYESSIDFLGIKISLDAELDSSGASGTKYILSNENGYSFAETDPNNYICLDNRTSGTCGNDIVLFRMIGLFAEEFSLDGTTSAGTKKLLKIIDTNNYGDTSEYSWNENGTNNWPELTLYERLNNSYLDNIILVIGKYNENIISKIISAKWHLGGASESNLETLTKEKLYTKERNTSAIYGSNPSSVYAQVGLMYPSDYGYATIGGTTTNKSSCRAKELYNWDDSSYSDCSNNDWLFNTQSGFLINIDGEWLFFPSSSDSSYATFIVMIGSVFQGNEYSVKSFNFPVRPVLYLDAGNINIVGGDGSSSNPYRIN